MKKSILYSSYCFMVGALAVSCQEVIQLEIPNKEPQLVIEGTLTYWQDEPEKNNCTVHLSNTGNYYDQEAASPVTDAVVELLDETNNIRYDLAPLEDQPGVFSYTNIPMQPENAYTLNVVYNEQEYTANGRLLPVAQVDSFSYRYQPEQFFQDEGYYLYFSGTTPKERGINYYRFKIYKNDSLYNSPGDYLIQSDELLSEKLDTVRLANYAFQPGEVVRVEMYSLDKNMFTYYNELLELLFNDGGLFSSPPRNPSSNIRNITSPQDMPLGFFQVSTALGEDILIEEK